MIVAPCCSVTALQLAPNTILLCLWHLLQLAGICFLHVERLWHCWPHHSHGYLTAPIDRSAHVPSSSWTYESPATAGESPDSLLNSSHAGQSSKLRFPSNCQAERIRWQCSIEHQQFSESSGCPNQPKACIRETICWELARHTPKARQHAVVQFSVPFPVGGLWISPNRYPMKKRFTTTIWVWLF